ncbi:hypothetical protein [Maribacter sp. Asnod2-G09]|uniref:hypothetical protein n=1 Tax=Maribacter sp. Asnod2-G09 TaxID=3160577 RepID=UPI003866A187
MVETLHFISEILRVDIIIAFGFYTIVFFLVRYFSKHKEFLNNFDRTAINLVIFSGIVFGVLWFIRLFISYVEIESEMDKIAFTQRLTGKYSFGIWLQPLFWVFLSQLLWYKKITNNLFYRLLLSLMFLVSFERMVVIATSLHRDYLPSSWSSGLNFGQVLAGTTGKVVVFILIVGIIHLLLSWVKNELKK